MKANHSHDVAHLAIRTLPLLVAMAFNPALAQLAGNALPTGGQIVAGQGALQQAGNTLNVLQNSQQMITNWQSFNIGQQAAVNFIQPNASALVLNRVIGADPSQIFGQMRANGQVMLINPNGILFGPTAQINVGALMASSHAISNEDFLSGKFTLGGASQAVRNAGSIAAADGGYVLLAGAQVDNSGSITANSGTVALAAGRDISVTVGQTGLLKVKVDTAAAQASINNAGALVADGGHVLLTAKQAAPLASVAINQTGVVRADTLNQKQGEIWIDGGAGKVVLAGDTRAQAASGQGGRIVATGGELEISGTVNASGAQGGGQVYLGGGWQGKDPAIAEAGSVTIQQGAHVAASATDAGNGGTVVAWSADATRLLGSIEAKGAGQGNGGQVETSSRGVLGVSGSVSAAGGAGGQAGRWLLDPTDITVVGGATGTAWPTANGQSGAVNNVLASSIEASLNAGSSVELQADNKITIQSDISKTAGGDASLGLSAGGDILLDTGADISSTVGKLNVDFGTASKTAGSATLKGTVNTNGGNVTFHKEAVLAHGTPISTKITQTSSAASGNITFNKDVKLAAQAYSVALNAQGAQSGANYTGSGGNIIFNGSITSSTPDLVPLSPQALSLDSTGSTAGNIILGSQASDRIGGSGNEALRSLTLAGDTDIALKAGTINLLSSSGDVLTASNIANTTTTLTLNADTVINVGGGTIPGVATGYTDYRQQTFNISGQTYALTINSARSIKLKNTGIDVKTLSLNAFADSAATAGGVLLDNASLTTRGGNLFIGKDGGFATGYGGDADGVTDGVRLSNAVINTQGGNLQISGQAPTSSSAGAGVKITGAATQVNTGAGNLTINGKVANQAGSGNKDGVIIGEDGASRVTLQTSSGKLTIDGDASSLTTTPTGGTRYDGVIISSKALIKTDSGDIQITGKGGGGSHAFLTENHGIRIEDTETSIVSASGDITLSGTSGGKTSATGGENSFGIYAKGQTMYLGSSATESVAATGVVTVEADSMQFVNSSDFHLNVASSGELRVRPLSTGRNIDISSAGAVDKLYLGNDWFNGSSRAIFRPGFGSGSAANPGITLGRTDGTGSLTVSSATTLRDNTALVMGGAGGKVLINAALTVKASDAAQSRQLVLDVNGGATGNGVINTNKLLLNGSGDVVLGGANLVDTLTANLADRLDYTNAKSLLIGQGSYVRTNDPLAANLQPNTQTTTSSDGIVTSNDAVNITLSNGDLTLDRNISAGTATVALTTQAGGISQQSAAIITADKLALSSQDSVTLDNTNQINVLAANVSGSGADLKLTNGKSLLLDRVAVTPLSADSSATVTVGSTQQRDGVSVNNMARLNLSAGDLSQSATAGQGRVTAANVKLTLASGQVALNDTTNDIGTLAATLQGSGKTLSVKDKNALQVGTVDGSNGVQTTNGDITLEASADAASTAGDLQLAQQVNAGTADVRLASGKGAINETAASGIITANELKLVAVNTSTLDSNNAVDEVTASISGSGQGVRLSNTRSLVVGDLDSQTGITAPGDVRLTLAAGNASVRNLTQTQDIKAGGLNVASDTGDITLERTTNEIGKLAARLDGAGKALKLKDKDGIEIATVDGRSGLQTNGGDINLVAAADAASSSGDLVMTADVSTGGSNGVVRLSSKQAAVSGAGKLTAKALLAQSVSGVNLSSKLSDVDTVAGSVSGSGVFSYKDIDTLEVGSVADAANVAVNGISTQNGNVQVSVAEDTTATGGDLNLTQSVTAGGSGKHIALQAYKGKVTETANVSLSADQLQLLARDTTELTNPATGSGVHNIGTLAAIITGADQSLTYFNSGALTVGSVTANDSVNPLQGVSTASSGHIAIATGNGALTLDKNVSAGGAGSVDLRAGSSGSDIVFNGGQATSGSGTVQLVAARDISTTTNNSQVNEVQTTGNVLLQAGRTIGADGKRIEVADADKLAAAAGGDVWLHKTRQSGSGDVKVDAVGKTTYNSSSFGGAASDQTGIRADGNIALNVADGQLAINRDIVATQGGSIDLRTGGSGKHIVFDSTAGVESSGNSGDRRIQLISSGNVLANGVDADANNEIRTSGSVLISAAGSVGASGNRIETSAVDTLAVESGSEQWLRQHNGSLTIGSVAALTPGDNALTRTAANLSGLVSKSGNSAIHQDVSAGQLVVDKTVSASGSGAVGLRASAAMRVQSGANITSQSGNILLSTGGTFSATDNSQGVQTISTAGGTLVIESNGAIDLSQGRLDTSGAAAGQGGEIYLHNAGANGAITVGQRIKSQGGSNANGGSVTLRNQNGNILLANTIDVTRGIGGSSDGAIQLQAHGDITDTTNGLLVGDSNGELSVSSSDGKISLLASSNGGHQMATAAFATSASGKTATVDYRDKTALTVGTAGGKGSALAGPQAAPSSQVAAVSGVRTVAGGAQGSVLVQSGGALTVSQAINTQPATGTGGKVTLRSDGALQTQASINTSGSVAGGDVLLARTGSGAGDITVGAAINSNGSQGGSVTLHNPAGKLLINGQIDTDGSSQGGRIQLASSGDISQSAALKASGGSAGALKIISAGQVTLEHTGNNVDTLAASLSGSGKAFSYLDADGLSVGSVSAHEGQAAIAGISSNNADITLRNQAGDITVAQAVSSQGGKVVLNAAQDALVNAGVATSAGQAQLQAGRDITLGADVQTAGGNATLSAARNLTQQAGSLLAGSGRATVTVGGAATQAGVGRIEAGELALSAVNNSSLLQANNIGTLAANISNGSLQLRDTDTLRVGTVGSLSGVTSHGEQHISVDGGDINVAQAMQANGGALTLLGGTGAISINAGLTAQGGDLTVRSTNGAIALNGDVNAAGRTATLAAGGANGQLQLAANVRADTVLLDAAQDILQQGSGSLSATRTEIKAGGSARLEGSNNLAGILAARTGGQLRYQDAGDLAVGTVNGSQGIQAGGTLWVRAKGNVTLDQSVSAAGGGNNALVLVAGKRLLNNAGSNALQASNGRWLAYDDNPLLLSNNLNYTFRRLATHYDRYNEFQVAEQGNGYLTTAVIGFTEQYSRLNGGATEAADAGVGVALPGGATRNRVLEVPVQQPASLYAAVLSRPSLASPQVSANGPVIQSSMPLVLPVQPGRDFVAAFRDLVGNATIESVRMADGSELPNWLLVNSSDQTLAGSFPKDLNTAVKLQVRVMDAGSSDIYPVELTILPRDRMASVGYR
ncbi:two-partner secretion domain-containing protein [Vogesella mureinivorans]|uniref:two-partner secretion domain-containing protein n=1 Tax=Vogesella mureinivorans TaxID=657276 RepID=UPI0014790278|nr:filamentous hemagglutinin N-terminal domain-containing protein [Vogesella mureinivorans]